MSDLRLEQAKQWLGKHFSHFEIHNLAGDASFRRYFRISTAEENYVLMDAPPEKEDVTPFVQIGDWLAQHQLRVPKIIIRDQHQGFLLLEDFGDVTWSVYHEKNHVIDPLFTDALEQLHRLQAAPNTLKLPCFGTTRMQRECDLYLDWYLPHIHGLTPNPAQRQAFHQVLQPLLKKIHGLPQAAVHLDYHSRNLMVPKNGLPLGIIDFQDAVVGPVTYDLASLLYDCYQDYPETERRHWSKHFFTNLNTKYKEKFQDFEVWHRAVRLTSLQRHIKVLGIFARLAHRDGKTQFLDEIPLTHQHCMQELQALSLQIPLLNA
ncbi:aminoglycoside phosphotransferase family protein [Ghiorsea bivora]|uniref:aminoglycoside phosphotransferase family protein n=1 Tax=Ghiorsea bivora TaxID=1485545 RepID=UPI00056F9131|nr:phosphotransferase [Ghiorsea bivora]